MPATAAERPIVRVGPAFRSRYRSKIGWLKDFESRAQVTLQNRPAIGFSRASDFVAGFLAAGGQKLGHDEGAGPCRTDEAFGRERHMLTTLIKIIGHRKSFIR